MAQKILFYVSLISLVGVFTVNLVYLLRQSPNEYPVKAHARKSKINLDESNLGETNSAEWINDIKPGDVIKTHDYVGNVEELERPMLLSEKMPKLDFKIKNNGVLFGLKIWSMDLKIGPIYALKHLFSRFGVKLIDRSISPLCHVTGTCADISDVPLNQWITLTETAEAAAQELFYRDLEFQEADAFICVYPTSLCELYIAYNKTIIFVIDSRYEEGRSEPFRWRLLSQRIKDVKDNGRAIVVGTNLYDLEYLRHYSGVRGTLLPFHCGYLQYYYKPKRREFLLMANPAHGFISDFLADWAEVAASLPGSSDAVSIKVVYQNETLTSQELRRYRGIIYIPHQVSFLSFTEKYRMGIPLFVPKVDLLVQWHLRYKILSERCLKSSQSRDRSKSNIDGSSLPDPNDEVKEWTVSFWAGFADFYEWPKIQHFRDIKQLYLKLYYLGYNDLHVINRAMMEENKRVQNIIEESWHSALEKIKSPDLS